jgi:hypothetical protein
MRWRPVSPWKRRKSLLPIPGLSLQRVKTAKDGSMDYLPQGGAGIIPNEFHIPPTLGSDSGMPTSG